MENLDGDKYYYDFERCRDYDIDDYLMSFADMIAVSGVYDDEKNTVRMTGHQKNSRHMITL